MNKVEKLFVENVSGATFIALDTLTPVKLVGGKANPDQGRITKQTIGSNVMVFQNKNSNAYQNMINKRLISEGKNPEFQVGERTWGTRIKNTPFVEHNGEMYLEVIFLKCGDVTYLRDGQLVNKSDIQGLPVEQEGGNQGGLDNKVIIRSFKFSSITGVTINGAHHTI